jgi:hypothetical protein
MTDPIDALVADLRTDVPDMSDEVFDAGRARLRSAIVVPVLVAAEPKPPAATPSRKRRLLRSPPRKLVSMAAAVVVLAATVLFVQAARSDGHAPVASAAAQLNAAADQIEPVDEPIEPGQYRYFISRFWSLNGPMMDEKRAPGEPLIDPDVRLHYLLESVKERWVPADTTQDCTNRNSMNANLRWVVGDEAKAAEAGHRLPTPYSWEQTMPCNGKGPGSEKGWWGAPTPQFLASLPRDPAQLYDRLRQDDLQIYTSVHPDLALIGALSTTLSTGQVPAELRATMYRTLAMVPGLQITEQFANVDGHKGTAYGISQNGERRDVIIDPVTGQFIGERRIDEVGRYGVPAGTVVEYSSVSNPVVVDEPGATS